MIMKNGPSFLEYSVALSRYLFHFFFFGIAGALGAFVRAIQRVLSSVSR